MKKQLLINGEQQFMGVNIPIIQGGFGENQKVMLAKTISEIHEQRMDKINSLINDNIDEFEIGIDLLDLKDNEEFANLCKVNGLYTQNALNSSKNIYLLSEQGYMLLVGFMKTDKAKEIRKQLRREYFVMRQIIETISEKDRLLLGLFSNDKMVVAESHKQLVQIEVNEAVTPLKLEIEVNKPLVEFGNQVLKSADNILVRELSKLAFEQGMNIGEKKLYKKLREWKYIMQNSTEPYQSSVNQGLFLVEEKSINTPYGVKLTKTTKVTPKGQVFIIEKLRKEMISK